jgi:hypothetical protein
LLDVNSISGAEIESTLRKAKCYTKERTDLKFKFMVIDLLSLLLIFIFNCNWVDTRWQQYSIHLHTNSTQNTQNGTYITIKKIGNCGPCPVFASYTLAFALQVRKKHGKTSGRVVEKCPDIPVAVVSSELLMMIFQNVGDARKEFRLDCTTKGKRK